MSAGKRRRNTIIAIVVILILILLLLVRCSCKEPLPEQKPAPTPAAPAVMQEPTSQGKAPPDTKEADEVLTPATVTVPERVPAGAAFSVAWLGPENRGDYLTIVPRDASAQTYGDYKETDKGNPLQLTAPMEPGAHEVRYVTRKTRTVLGRAPVEVLAVGATLDAPAEVVLGSKLSVTWTGPNNQGDYVTIVAVGTPDGEYGNYTYTEGGSPLSLLAPAETGEAELRYVSGQGKKVLARRPIRIAMADVSLSAPDEAVAGTVLAVTWSGPNNGGDYLTVVPKATPDGQYGNYTETSAGSPLQLLLPIMAGAAELRYMTPQGNRVLARRALQIVAAEVSLTAPDEAKAGSTVAVTWTGPNNRGDYLTVVPKATPDGQYGNYTYTTEGSPLNVALPKEPGDAELRYMTGQGNVVLARRPIRIVP